MGRWRSLLVGLSLTSLDVFHQIRAQAVQQSPVWFRRDGADAAHDALTGQHGQEPEVDD